MRISAKPRPTPLLGIPLGAPYSGWSRSPVLPQLPAQHPSPLEPPGGETDQDQPASPDPVARVELLADRSRHQLTPMDVQARRFTRVRQSRGYDMREVDEFLDEVTAELVRLHEHIQQLEDQPHRHGATAQPDQAAHPDADADAAGSPPLGRVRVLAVKVAADILADALYQAEEIYRTAYQQAAELLADARHDAPASASAEADTPADIAPTPPTGPPAAADPLAPGQETAGTPAPVATGAADAVTADPDDPEGQP